MNISIKSKGIIAIIILGIIGLGSYLLWTNFKGSQNTSSNNTSHDTPRVGDSGHTIFQNIAETNDLSTFNQALNDTSIASLLKETGPFTVFAPSNEAFKTMSTKTIDTLSKPENKLEYTSLIAYHIVPGIFKKGDLKDGQKLTTIYGQLLDVKIVNNDTIVGGSKIKTSDIGNANGTIHILDNVLSVPDGVLVGGATLRKDTPFAQNIIQANNLQIFSKALIQAKINDALSNPTPTYTIFVPSDTAFSKLPKDEYDSLFNPSNTDSLIHFIQGYIVEGVYMSSDLSDGQKLKTQNGHELTVTKKDGELDVDGIKVEIKDIISQNGNAFIIDTAFPNS